MFASSPSRSGIECRREQATVSQQQLKTPHSWTLYNSLHAAHQELALDWTFRDKITPSRSGQAKASSRDVITPRHTQLQAVERTGVGRAGDGSKFDLSVSRTCILVNDDRFETEPRQTLRGYVPHRHIRQAHSKLVLIWKAGKAAFYPHWFLLS